MATLNLGSRSIGCRTLDKEGALARTDQSTTFIVTSIKMEHNCVGYYIPCSAYWRLPHCLYNDGAYERHRGMTIKSYGVFAGQPCLIFLHHDLKPSSSWILSTTPLL